VTVEASDFPDAVPALAALAAFADGESRFVGVAHLRWKESDRLTSLAAVLESAGAAASAAPDSLSVRGPAARPGGEFVTLPTFRDHRIAMAAALLSLRLPGLLIENPDCVSKSYPGFFRDLDGLCRR
jgi:3-phosphoshikimate 1-carboxyvinyltransferase